MKKSKNDMFSNLLKNAKKVAEKTGANVIELASKGYDEAKEKYTEYKEKAQEKKEQTDKIKKDKKMQEEIDKHYFNIGTLYLEKGKELDDFHIISYKTEIKNITKKITELLKNQADKKKEIAEEKKMFIKEDNENSGLITNEKASDFKYAFNRTAEVAEFLIKEITSSSVSVISDTIKEIVPYIGDTFLLSQDFQSNFLHDKNYKVLVNDLNKNIINIGEVIYKNKLIKNNKKVSAEYKMIEELKRSK